MDETCIQCNKEAGKKASSESFMWVMRSAASEKIQAIFFFYSRSRNGDTAVKLLGSFCRYLITDAYAGYEKVEHIKRALCWCHCRRYFIDKHPTGSERKRDPRLERGGGKGIYQSPF